MKPRCELCGNQFPTATGRCVVCEEELREQRDRMDLPDPDERIFLQPVLDEIAARAEELPYGLNRQSMTRPVRALARARGVVDTRRALIDLAAHALRAAYRLPSHNPDERDADYKRASRQRQRV